MWAHLTFHQIETLKSSAFMSTLNSTTPSSISYYQKIHGHQITQKACENRTMISEKRSKDFGHVQQSYVVWFFLIERTWGFSFHTWKNKVLPYSPGVGLSQALQSLKIHGFNCDILFYFFKFNNLLGSIPCTHYTFVKVNNYRDEISNKFKLKNCGIKSLTTRS
jgi:hypothetical protein